MRSKGDHLCASVIGTVKKQRSEEINQNDLHYLILIPQGTGSGWQTHQLLCDSVTQLVLVSVLVPSSSVYLAFPFLAIPSLFVGKAGGGSLGI